MIMPALGLFFNRQNPCDSFFRRVRPIHAYWQIISSKFPPRLACRTHRVFVNFFQHQKINRTINFIAYSYSRNNSL